ncbi:hypothetical protein F4781DRAFT_378575 [Annulohypoxylon bovei var. microspora]|nr:hypothetical protein F4781DRAFT_378575 [Annulohypoxylon bovei var. microspora]
MFSRTTRYLAPSRVFTARQSILAQSTPLRRPWSRFSSSQTPSPQEPSPNSQFFKTFGRPIAKVFLLAILTYQLAYYSWVRLEHFDIKSNMQGTCPRLPPVHIYPLACSFAKLTLVGCSEYCRP